MYQVKIQSSTERSTKPVVETSATTETDTADTTDAMSATLENLTDTARDVIEEFNPFRDPEENS